MATTTYTSFGSVIVGESRNGQKRDYMPDTLGSTAALLDNTQSQTATWKYWPYGEVRSGGTATQFLFVGTLGYRGDDNSRAYVRARELRKAQARWMQVDPLWPLEPVYRYLLAPLSGTDPSGLQAGCGNAPPEELGGYLETPVRNYCFDVQRCADIPAKQRPPSCRGEVPEPQVSQCHWTRAGVLETCCCLDLDHDGVFHWTVVTWQYWKCWARDHYIHWKSPMGWRATREVCIKQDYSSGAT